MVGSYEFDGFGLSGPRRSEGCFFIATGVGARIFLGHVI